MTELQKMKCKACEGGMDPLDRTQINTWLEQVPDWRVCNDKSIERDFQFRDFAEALNFVNRVADIAESEKHHPDILIHGWNKVKITLWTHAIDGLSINDFVVAAKIDRL